MSSVAEEGSSKVDNDQDDSIDVSLLRELGKNALINALNSVNGAKTLVLDPSIAGPLGLLTEVSLLKQHGVDKMFWLESGPLIATTTNVVYLTRPKINWIKIIAEQIKKHGQEGKKHSYTILLVPRTSTLVTRVLEEEGVLGDVTLSAFNMQFIPIADDVISLEHESAFKEIWVDGDESVIYDASQALVTFQKLYGLFPRIVGKGDYSGHLANLLTRHLKHARNGAGSDNLATPSDRLDSLIVLDRRVDMITPLLTQLTYEGLVDELVGIKNSYVELPASLLAPPTQGAQASQPSADTPSASALAKETKKKHHLNASTDVLFGELRDLNFSSVGKTLNKHARRLDDDYKSRLQAKTVQQLRDFVGKLGGLQNEHQSLRIHTGLSEMLVPLTRTEGFNKALEIQQNLLSSYEVSTQVSAIEDLIAQGESMQMILRLACLASLVNGGIKAKSLDNIKREILQSYGYENLSLLLSLTSAPLGLLVSNPLPPTAPSLGALKLPYASLRKSLKLVAEDVEEADAPDDISYVYSGYAPLSVRLVQCVVQKDGLFNARTVAGDSNTSKKGKGVSHALGKVRAHPIAGWKGFEDIVNSIPGEVFDITQNDSGVHNGEAINTATTQTILPLEKITTSVVFFLGGCTYTEIAALRWISQHCRGRRILIATTSIISGASLINNMADDALGRTDNKGAAAS